jgi:tetratricopeptide (TPR) repeat protein
MSALAWLFLALAPQDVRAELARLDAARGAQADAVLSELVRSGAPAARAALELDFGAQALEARRARSALLRHVGEVDAIPAAIALLDDSDALVRANLCAWLGAPRLGRELSGERCAALESVARAASEGAVREAALAALERIDHDEAARALARCVLAAVGDEQRALAMRLAAHGRARDVVCELATQAASGALRELRGEALAEVVRSAGGALADVPAGGSSAADRAVFLLAARHPEASVRAAAGVALERFIARCEVLGEHARAATLLGALGASGLDDGTLVSRRIALELARRGGAEKALELAQALIARAPLSNDPRSRTLRARAHLFSVAALVALGRGAECELSLTEAEAALGALRRERWDLRGRDDRDDFDAQRTDDLLLSALVPLWRTLVALQAGARPGSLAVLELARAADLALLEVQLEVSRVSWNMSLSHDELLQHPLGPTALVLGADALGKRALELELDLCRALASTCGGGLPGFEAYPELEPRLAQPLADPVRKKLLVEIQAARRESALSWIDRETERLDRAAIARDPTRLVELDVLRSQVLRMFEREVQEGDAALLRQRGVSRAGLQYAERAREQGRAETARRIAERAATDLEALRGTLGELDLARYLAAAESAQGGALMDLERGTEAERVFQRALERLDGAAREVEQREDKSGARLVRAQRAGMLTSLAVNANVKLRSPAKALEYFERAYELDQSDFMKVLLACYRARAGQATEARAALAELRVTPANYYNLACTWALLGETELALDYLARDFAEVRTQEGARERQRTWAAGDPDLESLRGDPRFEALVKPTAEPSNRKQE